ncbi:MAG: TIGR02680 family protein, partial [Acidimicrobiales bacterium]
MTNQLFQAVDSPAGAPPLRPAERFDRWVLHRAGIINVWQYDRTEIGFAGGRALLRGKNGAGKSKALEVLLPFLLDGDTRSIDAAGRDRTSVYWLMTEGRDPGNHVGYVWLELRHSHHHGSERFLTLGAGLKAATSTRSHSSWFVQAEGVRVGVDLHLGPEVSSERLREILGSDAVPTGAE